MEEENRMTNFGKTTHLIMRVSGSVEKIRFFHSLMERLDCDWPYQEEKWKICKVCGGGMWNNPRFCIKQLKILAKQTNECKGLRGTFKLKVDSWGKSEKCQEKMEEKLKNGEWRVVEGKLEKSRDPNEGDGGGEKEGV